MRRSFVLPLKFFLAVQVKTTHEEAQRRGEKISAIIDGVAMVSENYHDADKMERNEGVSSMSAH